MRISVPIVAVMESVAYTVTARLGKVIARTAKARVYALITATRNEKIIARTVTDPTSVRNTATEN